jgi:hypothetical protein
MNNLTELWKKYNYNTVEISTVLGRTSNIVGEYAEHLINNHLKGKILEASTASADIKTSDNKYYQVKARKISNNLSTQLGIIRSWNFDYLAVILFSQRGEVLKSIICPRHIAEKYAVHNKHQNGWVITTSQDFLHNPECSDITQQIKMYNGESVNSYRQVDEAELGKSNDIGGNTTTTSVTVKTKMSRSEALRITNIYLYQKYHQTINGKQFVFSNQNKTNDKWWFEPKIETFENDLFIALNDNKLNKLYLFKIPSRKLFPPDQYFKIRPDTNKPTINIEGHDTLNFQDCSKGSAKIAFKKFLIKTFEYQ